MEQQDICILSDRSGSTFSGSAERAVDCGLLLLQRLCTLMLTDLSTTYRNSSQTSVDLLAFLEGGNVPTDSSLLTNLALAKSAAYNALDAADKRYISDIELSVNSGELFVTLTLKDGTTVKGKLQ